MFGYYRTEIRLRGDVQTFKNNSRFTWFLSLWIFTIYHSCLKSLQSKGLHSHCVRSHNLWSGVLTISTALFYVATWEPRHWKMTVVCGDRREVIWYHLGLIAYPLKSTHSSFKFSFFFSLGFEYLQKSWPTECWKFKTRLILMYVFSGTIAPCYSQLQYFNM